MRRQNVTNSVSDRSGAHLGSDVVGDGQSPLKFLLRMMDDPSLSDRARIDIAKSCLPYVHSRIASASPPEPNVEQNPAELTDATFQLELARTLAFAISTTRHRKMAVSDLVVNAVRAIGECLEPPAAPGGTGTGSSV